jgi:hypothetical protein
LKATQHPLQWTWLRHIRAGPQAWIEAGQIGLTAQHRHATELYR